MAKTTKSFNKRVLSEAEIALKDWGIRYSKNRITGIITVQSAINLDDRDLEKLPDLSAVIVEKYFSCSGNLLTSLVGAPHSVGGSFYCNGNLLTSLFGAPQTVGVNFHCGGNQLEDLHGAPQGASDYFTPFGDFSSWAEIPDDVKKSPARIAREIAREKAELCKKVKAEIHAGTTRELHTTRIRFIKKKPAP